MQNNMINDRRRGSNKSNKSEKSNKSNKSDKSNKSSKSNKSNKSDKSKKSCKRHTKVSHKKVLDKKKCVVDEKIHNVEHIKELHIFPVTKNVHTYRTRVIHHKKKVIDKKHKLATEYIHLDKSDDEKSCGSCKSKKD
jgi:hypothetical protein